MDRGERTCAEYTRQLIRKHLGRTPVDIDSIAAELSLTARSLRRRLKDEDTSFRNLLQDEMQAVLSHGDASLDVLAEGLSYSDATVLSRAFKTWTGVSPRHYKKVRS